ncbi:MAG: TonB-dependent receptor [Gammaproteobacteria bacterium]|nr:TonB-dependent receptor [Gammaproteobacteria bacterium]
MTYSKLTSLGWIAAAIAMAFGTIATAAAAADERKVSLDIERKNAGAALVELGESAGIQIAVPSGISGEKELGPINGRYTVVEALDSMLKDSGLAYHFAANDSVAIGLDEAEPDGGGDGGGVIEPALLEDDEEDDVELIVVTGSRLPRQPGQMDRQVTVYDRFEIEASGVTTVEEFMRRLPQSFNARSSNGAALDGNFFGSTRNFFGAAGVNLRGLGERATLILIDGKRTARGGVLGEATDINQIPISMIERVEVIFDGASAIYGADAVGGVVNVITRKDYQGVDVRINHSQPQAGGTAETSVTFGGTHSWGTENRGSATLSYEYLTRDPLDGDERDLQFATSSTVYEIPYGWPPNIEGGSVYEFGVGSVQQPLFLLDADGNPVPVGDPTGVTEVFRSRMPDDSDGDLTLADFRGLSVQPGSRAEAGQGLVPGRDDHSWRLSMRQELTERLELSGAIARTTGDTYSLESNQNRFYGASPLNVTPWGTTGTPHTPFQGPVNIWAEFDFLPDVERFTEKEALSGHVALDGRVAETWEWEVVASRASSENHGLHFNEISGPFLYCVGNPLADQCSADPRLGTLNAFDLPYFGLASQEEFVDLMVIKENRTASESTDTEYAFTVRGALFKAPGGNAQSLFSVSRRAEVTYLFDETGTAAGRDSADAWFGVFPTLGGDPELTRGYDHEMIRDTDSVSFELNVPLFGGDNARPGLQGLDVTVSARYDDVTSGGGRIIETENTCCPFKTTITSDTPVIREDTISAWSTGFVWQPTDWLKVRANVNESYAAPPLTAYVNPTIRSLATFRFVNDDWTSLLDENGVPVTQDIVSLYGGNPELLPESNTTRSFGFDMTPQALPNLVARVNFHWNELVDRIGQWQPRFRGFTPEALNPDAPGIQLDEETGRVVWPNSGQRANLGTVETNGIDLDLTYFFESSFGDFDMRLDYGYLTESVWRQVDDCGPQSVNCSYPAYGEPVDVVGTVPLWVLDEEDDFYILAPFDVAPKHRFDLRLGWAWRGWRVDVTASHQSQTVKGVSRYNSQTGERFRGTSTVTAANPVNVVVRYDFEQAEWKPELLRNTRIQLAVPNLFDSNAKFELEPKFAVDTGGIFDSVASRPRGRAFTLTIERKFAKD